MRTGFERVRPSATRSLSRSAARDGRARQLRRALRGRAGIHARPLVTRYKASTRPSNKSPLVSAALEAPPALSSKGGLCSALIGSSEMGSTLSMLCHQARVGCVAIVPAVAILECAPLLFTATRIDSHLHKNRERTTKERVPSEAPLTRIQVRIHTYTHTQVHTRMYAHVFHDSV